MSDEPARFRGQLASRRRGIRKAHFAAIFKRDDRSWWQVMIRPAAGLQMRPAILPRGAAGGRGALAKDVNSSGAATRLLFKNGAPHNRWDDQLRGVMVWTGGGAQMHCVCPGPVNRTIRCFE